MNSKSTLGRRHRAAIKARSSPLDTPIRTAHAPSGVHLEQTGGTRVGWPHKLWLQGNRRQASHRRRGRRHAGDRSATPHQSCRCSHRQTVQPTCCGGCPPTAARRLRPPPPGSRGACHGFGRPAPAADQVAGTQVFQALGILRCGGPETRTKSRSDRLAAKPDPGHPPAPQYHPCRSPPESGDGPPLFCRACLPFRLPATPPALPLRAHTAHGSRRGASPHARYAGQRR